METSELITKHRLTVTPEYDGTWLVFKQGKMVGKHENLVTAVRSSI